MKTAPVYGALALLMVVSACAADPPRASLGDDQAPIKVPPRSVGQVKAEKWQPASEAEQAASVEELKTFATKAIEQTHHPLHLLENRSLLFYSDLPENQATRFLALLERSEGKLRELFPLPKGQNLWRGKGLVMVFAQIEDYRIFERGCEDSDPGGSCGMTHCYGDGMVHMAFYRYPDDAQFEHLLVHEEVHGFLHRYRSPARVPSWINEGLADTVASELVSDPRRAALIRKLTHTEIEGHGNSVDDLFSARHIDGWQYPIAESLNAWMIHQNRSGYLELIKTIKDGQPWEQGLGEKFGMGTDRLLQEFAKASDIKSIK